MPAIVECSKKRNNPTIRFMAIHPAIDTFDCSSVDSKYMFRKTCQQKFERPLNEVESIQLEQPLPYSLEFGTKRDSSSKVRGITNIYFSQTCSDLEECKRETS